MSARAGRAGIALHKLARIYERRGEAEEAARCYEENLARIDAERLAGSDTLDALLFLAAYKKARAAALGGRCTGRPLACRRCTVSRNGGECGLLCL